MTSKATLFRHLLAVAAVALAGCAAPPATCQLNKLADLPVVYVDGRMPAVVIKVEGHDERMLVDTGADDSLLRPDTYNALDLSQAFNATGTYAQGAGGIMQINTLVLLDLAIGQAKLKDKVVYVSNFGLTDRNGRPYVDGILGFDVLQSFDVAFDLPDNRITLYVTSGCSATETPWTGDFAVLNFIPRHDRLDAPYIPIQIDNQNFTALLDSGADSSLIRQTSLSQQGVTAEATSTRARTSFGIGNLPFGYHRQQYVSLTIGAETISNAWLNVTERGLADTELDGVIGEDYLRYHRVFLVGDTRTAYLGLSVPATN